jgi:hypothetical protein
MGRCSPSGDWNGVADLAMSYHPQIPPFCASEQGLRVSVDACDLVMQDNRNGNVNGEFYQHRPENVNLMPACLNYAKHVLSMSALLNSLKAMKLYSMTAPLFVALCFRVMPYFCPRLVHLGYLYEIPSQAHTVLISG